MTPKGRNNIRGMFAGAANAAALAISGLGLIRPIFDVSIEVDLGIALTAAFVSVVLWTGAAYVHSKTENE